MQTADPASLDRLNDFVLPEPVGFWPLAPVWYFAIGLACVWLTNWAWGRWVQYRHDAYRREAIAELHTIAAGRNEAFREIVKLNELLKRTAMTAYGRDQVASLYGDRWVRFLESEFATDVDLRVLSDASSRTSLSVSADEQARLFAFAGNWIRRHGIEGSSAGTKRC